MKLRSIKLPVLVWVLAAVLSACGSNPYSLPKVSSPEPDYDGSEQPSVQSPETESEPPASSPDIPSKASPISSSAHSGLLASADTASNQGNYDRALAYLERAQRIEPDNAEIYLQMAQTHAAAGSMAQARATAERGLLYCSNNSQCDALRAYLSP